MTDRLDPEQVRSVALEHWRYFCTRILRGIVRRIAGWKRLSRAAQLDLLEDLQQEIAADCLADAAEIVVQPPRVRHGRWIRLVERFVYRNHVVVARHVDTVAELAVVAPPCLVTLPDELPRFERLANGRRNLRGTAQRHGLSERDLRGRLESLVDDLGADDEHRSFWRARLAEGLTGLAADLLQEQGRVHLVARSRRAPDSPRRLRRLRRMLVHFHIRPSTRHERAILRRSLQPRPDDAGAPRWLLESATELAPYDRASWLWLFEACIADGDARGAARALRECRRRAAPTACASTLARARLLEARGALARAQGVVVRAAQRWPQDRTLAALAATLTAGRDSVAGRD